MSADIGATTTAFAWWIWPLALFFTSFLLGIVAVIAGIGGGVLFVPIVGGFFPFHLDFVRGAGVLLALAAALAAAPRLLRDGLASLRLALPLAVAGSVFSILGALASFSLPTGGLETALGVLVLAIALLMIRTRTSAGAAHSAGDALARVLGMRGAYIDPADGKRVEWAANHTIAGMVAFAVIGFLGGLFGLGAGWANVPALNLLMDIPLKLAAGTSGLVITMVNAPATWIYFQQGAMLPIIVAPSLIGVMLGARVGVRLFRVLPAPQVRLFVIALLFFAGARSLLKGLQLWS
jgi:uncharacterized membrane protein YfcA